MPTQLPFAELLAQLDEHNAILQVFEARIAAAESTSAPPKQREDAVRSLVAQARPAHVAFEALHDELELAWSTDRSLYDPVVHDRKRAMARRWLGAACRIVGLLDSNAYRELEFAEAATARALYVDLLGIEWMDHGPMPEHMRERARQAGEVYRRERPEPD